jgi:hypothetical protein
VSKPIISVASAGFGFALVVDFWLFATKVKLRRCFKHLDQTKSAIIGFIRAGSVERDAQPEYERRTNHPAAPRARPVEGADRDRRSARRQDRIGGSTSRPR